MDKTIHFQFKRQFLDTRLQSKVLTLMICILGTSGSLLLKKCRGGEGVGCAMGTINLFTSQNSELGLFRLGLDTGF